MRNLNSLDLETTWFNTSQCLQALGKSRGRRRVNCRGGSQGPFNYPCIYILVVEQRPLKEFPHFPVLYGAIYDTSDIDCECWGNADNWYPVNGVKNYLKWAKGDGAEKDEFFTDGKARG